jgi:hypothetical protein
MKRKEEEAMEKERMRRLQNMDEENQHARRNKLTMELFTSAFDTRPVTGARICMTGEAGTGMKMLQNVVKTQVGRAIDKNQFLSINEQLKMHLQPRPPAHARRSSVETLVKSAIAYMDFPIYIRSMLPQKHRCDNMTALFMRVHDKYMRSRSLYLNARFAHVQPIALTDTPPSMPEEWFNYEQGMFPAPRNSRSSGTLTEMRWMRDYATGGMVLNYMMEEAVFDNRWNMKSYIEPFRK